MAETILHRILETKRKEVAALYGRTSLEAMRDRAAQADRPRNFYSAVTRKPRRLLNLIAEAKKASPSAGVIREDFDPAAIAREYEAGGASAMSVLTDEQYFQGHLDYLVAARQACSLPVLRKDFIIDPIQVFEARAAGADAILLIAAALPPGELVDLMILATELGMTTLLEVHDVDEVMGMRSVVGFPLPKYGLLGINNRDLATFEVNLGTTLRLIDFVGDQTPVVSESGIKTREDVEKLREAGVSAMLVGETLMRSGDFAQGVNDLLGPEEGE
jgi:indole-3-glycerol phosphate synthase